MSKKIQKDKKKTHKRKMRYRRPVNWLFLLLLMTAFQIFCAIQILTNGGEDIVKGTIIAVFALYITVEWTYFIVFAGFLRRKSFEVELIAFFLSGIGLALTTSVYPNKAYTQLIAILLGIGVFIVLLWILSDIDRVVKLRMPVAILSIAALVFTLIFAKNINGARNWIVIGNGLLSIQTSEIVKVAFIFVGAATLETLQSTKLLTKYIIFAVTCVGLLFIMKDFGTALIFFFTFVIIAFLRSGDIKTIFLICAGALIGGIGVLTFKPYVANRFNSYRHIWEFADTKGYQQVRLLIYSVSGGLFGLGLGNGKLRGIYASTEDLAFGMVCEEFGIIIAFTVLLTFVALVVYSIRYSVASRSSFYSIAACAASALLLFQTALHVFGATDLLPWTGVTLPFISRGGSSMMCCWGLVALIKAIDVKTYKRYDKVVKG
ncbi:MAG: FtsW/RodA/SpoVE family cell cycle protein [Ruminococcus sp.]|nr:FtsW/RodA/SpoVE family cell cycle protein [Ruminococcus sp.]MDY6059752.1 FtsW/RodA/SpoVE family cell cycle protein [Candidatus Fimenecus sp.]